MEFYLQSLGSAGQAFFGVFGCLALAHLLGLALLRRRADLAEPEKFFQSMTLGIDLLAVAAIPLTWAGWLDLPFWDSALAAALVGSGWLLVRRLRWRSFPWHFLPFLAIGLILARNAVSYPFSWDDLTYQVTVPWRWYKSGTLAVFRDNPYSGFPAAFSIANVLLLARGGIMAPGLFNALLWLIVSLQTFFLVRDNLSTWPAVAATLAFSFSLSMIMVAVAAYAELFLLLHVIGSVSIGNRILVRPTDAPLPLGDLFLLGVFGGMAASVKLTGLIVPCVIAVFLAIQVWRLRKQTGVFRYPLVFLLPLIFTLGVFYARPYLATGNPFYPYVAGFFTDDEAALETSIYHHEAGQAHFGPRASDPMETAAYFFGSPVLLTFGPFFDETFFDGMYGLQFLVLFGCICWLVWQRWRGDTGDPRLWFWLALALVFYVFWFFTSRQARFLLPAFFLVTLAGASALARLSWRVRTTIVILLPMLTVASVPWRIFHHLTLSWGILTGNVELKDYLYSATQDEYLVVCAQVRESLPPDAKVLLLFEQRGLYIARDYRIGAPFFQERYFTPSEKTRSGEEFLDMLRKEKFTHVLVGFSNKDPDRMEKYMERTRPFQKLILEIIAEKRLKSKSVWLSPHQEYGIFEVE